jgi:hypothetical protein
MATDDFKNLGFPEPASSEKSKPGPAAAGESEFKGELRW